MKVKRKVCFVGPEKVGKTAIISQYVKEEFFQSYHPTIGVDFISKTISKPSGTCQLQIWDTAGQARYLSLIPSYLKDSYSVFLIFDVTDEHGLTKLAKFVEFIQQSQGGNQQYFKVYLIGNKIDRESERKISQEVGMAYCEQNKFHAYFEISAIQCSDVKKLFDHVLSDLQQGVKEGQEKTENKEEVPKQVQVKAQEIKEEKSDQSNNQEEVTDKLLELDLCEKTLQYLQNERINYQILEFMEKSDIKGLKIVIGDQFRIIKKLNK